MHLPPYWLRPYFSCLHVAWPHVPRPCPQRVGTHLAVTTLIATVVAGTFGAARAGLLPDELALLVEGTAIPLFPHSAAGSVLGLLLAFRTSQSYDRFWEARTLWDGVYSSTRSITRLACATLQDGGKKSGDESEADAMRCEAIVGLCAAFPYALKQHLRGERNAEELLEAAAAASSCEASTCMAHAVHMHCTCIAHAAHMQCTCSAHDCTCSAHA